MAAGGRIEPSHAESQKSGADLNQSWATLRNQFSTKNAHKKIMSEQSPNISNFKFANT